MRGSRDPGLLFALAITPAAMIIFNDTPALFYGSAAVSVLISYLYIKSNAGWRRSVVIFCVLAISISAMSLIRHYLSDDAHSQDFPLHWKIISAIMYSVAILFIAHASLKVGQMFRKSDDGSGLR